MCGRYALHGPFSRHNPGWRDDWTVPLIELVGDTGRYNIAPSQTAPIVRATDGGTTEVVALRWGLLPTWARDARLAWHTINARAETIATKPAFRGAWRAGRRCLIPASGWYEWTVAPDGKQPNYITSAALGNPLMLAGLWEPPVPGAATAIGSYTIVTTDAEPAIAHLHARQPLVLAPADWDTWLAGSTADAAKLHVPPEAAWQHHPVSRAVNSPRSDDPRLILPSN
jgi:putative SOS response-associated peptidase YedK